MTKQIQILQRRLEYFSRDLKVLWIALKVFSKYSGGNRRWVLLPKVAVWLMHQPIPPGLFYKKRDLLARGFWLPTLSTSILFICFWIDLVRVLVTTKNTSAIAGYTCVILEPEYQAFLGEKGKDGSEKARERASFLFSPSPLPHLKSPLP